MTVSELRAEMHEAVKNWEEIEMEDLKKVSTPERTNFMREKMREMTALVCETYSGDFKPMYNLLTDFEKRAIEWVNCDVLLWEFSDAHRIESKIREMAGLSAL